MLPFLVAGTWASAPQPSAASAHSIEWTAPAECPDRSDVQARVSRSLGDDSVKPALTAAAKVTRIAGMYRASLSVQSAAGSGQRVLENASCEILADSVALVIALSASRFESAEPERSGNSLALSAHATTVSGLMPELALGVGGALAFEGLLALRWELSGSYYAPQTSTFERVNAGGKFSLLRLGARGCRIFSVGAFELAPCAGAELYRIEGEGFGGVRFQSGSASLWGPMLGIFVRWWLLRSFALFVAADGMVPVWRQRFVYSDLGSLHRTAPIAFQLFIAPEVRF